MDRRVLVSAMAASLFALGCGRGAPEQAATPAVPAPQPAPTAAPVASGAAAKRTPVPHKKLKANIALIKIGVDGLPDTDTLELEDFKGQQTTVVWVADCPAESLKVTFKPTCDGVPKPPHLKDPPCATDDIACAIDAARLAVRKVTSVCYRVELKLPGQADPIVVDPRIIINP